MLFVVIRGFRYDLRDRESIAVAQARLRMDGIAHTQVWEEKENGPARLWMLQVGDDPDPNRRDTKRRLYAEKEPFGSVGEQARARVAEVLIRGKLGLALLVVATLLAAAGTARADDPWTRKDTAFQATFLVTLAADWVQTEQIVKDGREWNPIIGERGERVPPPVYFVTVAFAHTVAMRLLPQPYRRAAQCVSIGVQIIGIERNFAAGYEVRW